MVQHSLTLVTGHHKAKRVLYLKMALRFKLRYQFYKTAFLLFMKRTVKNIYNDRKSKHFCFEVNSTARDVDESVHEFFSYMDADFDAVGKRVCVYIRDGPSLCVRFRY
jgi:diadenosine tetraphosphate (Ap4A) HIT family hydrolase